MSVETVYSGYNGRVLFGSATLMQMASWEYSGPTREMIDKGTAFNEAYKQVFPAALDGGTITVSGFYVPAATVSNNVQASLTSGSDVSNTPLKLYYSASGWWGVENTTASANTKVYVESVNGPTVDSNGVAEMTYNFRLSGGIYVKRA